jgi:DNA-binding GntR family transcriptional regulator
MEGSGGTVLGGALPPGQNRIAKMTACAAALQPQANMRSRRGRALLFIAQAQHDRAARTWQSRNRATAFRHVLVSVPARRYKGRSTMTAAPKSAPSRLQANLAQRILQLLHEQQAQPGHHLVEQELCDAFAVSRTPVRGALQLLAARGVLTAQAHRGFTLATAVPAVGEGNAVAEGDDEADRLFAAIARARSDGTLPDDVSQQEIVRRFGARAVVAVRVLRQLADLGLAARRKGNGWSFAAPAARVQADSYALRRAIEPAMLLLPAFRLDRKWAQQSREAHIAFRRKRGAASMAVFFDLNADFHEHLARCCGNRYMENAVRQQILLRRFLNKDWEYGKARVDETIDEHLEILSALEAGFADKAAALMTHHLTTSSHHVAARASTGSGEP